MGLYFKAVVTGEIAELSVESSWSGSNLGHVVVEDGLGNTLKVLKGFLMTID